jgi:hypothetical protein
LETTKWHDAFDEGFDSQEMALAYGASVTWNTMSSGMKVTPSRERLNLFGEFIRFIGISDEVSWNDKEKRNRDIVKKKKKKKN